MTPQEMKLRITEYGPDITDQQRLIICIEHYEIIKARASKSFRHLAKDDLPYDDNCALCDEYGGPSNDCTKDGIVCLLGFHGCIGYCKPIARAIHNRDHSRFIAAVDDMLAFLRSYLEGEKRSHDT